jgi:hypothetical protein
MAKSTLAVRNRIVRMLLDEKGVVGLVTAFAQPGNIVFQEKSGLGGCMRIVARDASFLHRIMFKFDLLYCIKLVFMAAVTQIVAALEQIELVVRGMRIMTLNTFAFESDLVGAARVILQYPFVARNADLAYLCRQLFWKVRCVGTVTRYTPRFIDRRMDKGFFQEILERRVACQADFLLCARLQPEFSLITFSAWLRCLRDLGGRGGLRRICRGRETDA